MDKRILVNGLVAGAVYVLISTYLDMGDLGIDGIVDTLWPEGILFYIVYVIAMMLVKKLRRQ